jgi:hypothetical protein
VVITLLCIVLSSWVGPAERQRRAVRAIEAVGGQVYYLEVSEGSVWRWLPQDYFDGVLGVCFISTKAAPIDGRCSLLRSPHDSGIVPGQATRTDRASGNPQHPASLLIARFQIESDGLSFRQPNG